MKNISICMLMLMAACEASSMPDSPVDCDRHLESCDAGCGLDDHDCCTDPAGGKDYCIDGSSCIPNGVSGVNTCGRWWPDYCDVATEFTKDYCNHKFDCGVLTEEERNICVELFTTLIEGRCGSLPPRDDAFYVACFRDSQWEDLNCSLDIPEICSGIWD
jgi:hypothetical protein